MSKEKLQKNVLDLAYHRQLSHLNAVLLLVTIGILSFIGTFIWKREFLTQGFILTVVILLVSYIFYKRIDKKIKEISNQIKKL